MKIYIVCDLEGTAGVVDHRLQCQWDSEKEWFAPFLHQARRLATLELNAAVQGAIDGGASEVWAWDGHGVFPGGLDIELLHPECKLVMSAGDGGPIGLDATFDALMMVGLHGMRNAPWGRLAHSFFGDIIGLWVNGQKWGEIAANAWAAGEHGVPVVFLAGDRSASEEASTLIPGLETVIVKSGLTDEPAFLNQAPTLSLSPSKARDLIQEGAELAMSKIGQISPFTTELPLTIRVEFERVQSVDWIMENREGVTRISENTAELRSEQFTLIV